MNRERTPAWKLFWAGLIGAVLIVPLLMVYALVYDRESTSQEAQATITAGWGGAQTITGPVLVIPFTQMVTTSETVDGENRTSTTRQRRELFTNLALGRPLVALEDDAGTMPATIGLIDPVDLYSQVDRAVKYGFLFIGFTFAAFLMFDVVGGARVASAEYLLTGAALVLFFVLLLAFAEVIGFGWAYLVAAGAVIGLLTAYSAAVLGTWRRAGFIGAMLAGLYGLLYVLLNLETYSLLIGALLMFAALAGIMYATRRVNWSGVGVAEDVADA